ncbi:MAG: prepilin peptidase [Lentisphaeria bacterium]|nr:prepilin peptidase [Lentisphaeria bacterium]
MNFDLGVWYHLAQEDWFIRWGLIYPGVWFVVIFWVFAFGACIGSFLNVCIWRIPRGESLSKAASHCTVCGNPIRWYDNIPVASYLILRGRCRSCRTPYSASYFAVELLCGILTALLVVKSGLSEQSAAVIPGRMLLIFFGVACAGTDWRFQVVPNKLTFSGMAMALLLAALLPSVWGCDKFWMAVIWSLLSGVIPALLLWLFALAGKKIAGQEVLGMGDVKFVAMCGMFLGLPGVLFTVIAGSFAGTLWGIIIKQSFKAKLPFVPFLMLGAVIWIFADIPLLDWYALLFIR